MPLDPVAFADHSVRGVMGLIWHNPKGSFTMVGACVTESSCLNGQPRTPDRASLRPESNAELEMFPPIRAVDLCCGAGGMSLGFSDAGFDIVGAVEFDPLAAQIHRTNFPNCKVLIQPLDKTTACQLYDAIGLEEGSVDVVFGGPPCQGFSQMGKRDSTDPRSTVLSDFARLSASLGPKVIVAENVRGLLMDWGARHLASYRSILTEAGYELVDPWLLNANDFGVPQRRERVFLVAVKAGQAIPRKPSKQEGPPPTVWDAISDLSNISKNARRLTGDTYRGPLRNPSDFALQLRENVGKHVSMSCCAMPKHSEVVVERFRNTPAGKHEPISRFQRLPFDGPAATLRAGTSVDKGSFMAGRPIHPREPRCITVREAARLHGFPDSFIFSPEHWHGFRQIGNAVPPPLAEAVAKKILSCLRDKYVQSTSQP
jgi:DNA (cytosine-5)-methyltransferase 1